MYSTHSTDGTCLKELGWKFEGSSEHHANAATGSSSVLDSNVPPITASRVVKSTSPSVLLLAKPASLHSFALISCTRSCRHLATSLAQLKIQVDIPTTLHSCESVTRILVRRINWSRFPPTRPYHTDSKTQSSI